MYSFITFTIICCIILASSHISRITSLPHDIQSVQVDNDLTRTKMTTNPEDQMDASKEATNIRETNVIVDSPDQMFFRTEGKLKNTLFSTSSEKRRFLENSLVGRTAVMANNKNEKEVTNPKKSSIENPELYPNKDDHSEPTSVLRIDESVAPKPDAVMVPPFPELAQLDGKQLYAAQERSSDSILNRRFIFNPNFSTGPILSKVSKKDMLEAKKKYNYSIPTIQNSEDASREQKFYLNIEDEEIFQSVPFRKFGEIQHVPPFEELHVPSQNRENEESVEKPVELLFIPEVSNVRGHAGPDLFASSIFEREIRVPFI